MPAEFASWASLGVGGAVAALVFHYYRVDRRSSERDRRENMEYMKAQSTILVTLVRDNTATQTRLVDVIEFLAIRIDRVDPPDLNGVTSRRGSPAAGRPNTG